MNKRCLALIFLVIVMICGCGNAGNNAESLSSGGADAADAPIELVWWTYAPDGTAPDAAAEVLQRANEISEEKIGVTVKMIYKSEEQFDLDLQTGEYYDMTFSCDWCNDLMIMPEMATITTSPKLLKRLRPNCIKRWIHGGKSEHFMERYMEFRCLKILEQKSFSV